MTRYDEYAERLRSQGMEPMTEEHWLQMMAQCQKEEAETRRAYEALAD